MVALVLAPVLLGVALYKLPSALAAVLALAGQAGIAAGVVALFLRAYHEGPFVEVLGGTDHLLHVSLRGDRTALALAAVTVLLFAAALVYCLREPFRDNKLLLLLLVLQGLAVGIFLADDVFTLFVLFEVATLVGILLLMFRRDRRSTYDGLYYLTIQIVAMMFFLFGVAYLYRTFGVLSVTELSQLVERGVDGRAMVLPAAFLLTGIGPKAGFFPLFSYVPRSYANPGAPTAVLMLLSGVLVNGALFWFARLGALFAPAIDLSGFLLVVGLATGVAGAVKALAQRDLRLILAYSTVSQAGLITLGLASGGLTAHGGGMFHLVSHALLKSVLFLTAGLIASVYGTTRIDRIRGVARRMPVVAVVTAVAVLGMVGAPFTAAGASKDLILSGVSGTWVEAAVWVVNLGTALVFARYAVMLFGRPDGEAAVRAGERAGRVQTGVVVALAAVCVAVGVAAPQVAGLLGVPAPSGLSLSKALGFLATVAGAVVVVRYGAPFARRLRALVVPTLSLPYAVLALTVFFVAAAGYGTLVTAGGAG